MLKIFRESIYIGIITALIGSIVIRIIINFNKNNDSSINEETCKGYKNYLFAIAFFFTGMLIHLLLEYSGFSKWYCEKKCIGDVCVVECKKGFDFPMI